MASTARPYSGERGVTAALRSPHHTGPVWIIAAALAVLLGVLPVNSEIIFHRRDHLDQGKYLSNQPEYNVHSYSDALVSHHAILKCGKRKLKAGILI